LECYINIKPWVLYFDGLKHVDGYGIGIVLISPNNTPLKILFEIKHVCSNNETRYEALFAGLETLLNLSSKHVLIREDFELVINQLT